MHFVNSRQHEAEPVNVVKKKIFAKFLTFLITALERGRSMTKN
jgi:hypothetical protein